MLRSVRSRILAVLIVSWIAGGMAWAQDTPSPDELIDRMIAAAGGEEAYNKLGILKLTIDENERTSKGQERNLGSFKGYASTERADLLRLEMPGEIVLGRSGIDGWATVRGRIDDRPPTPTKAKGSINAKLFPVLLPYSLRFPGLSFPSVEKTTWEGQPAWMLKMIPAAQFFNNMVFEQPWTIYVSRKNYQILAAEFEPPAEHAQVILEGVRYNILRTESIGGVSLPALVVMDGFDLESRLPNGHLRTTKVQVEVMDIPDYTLFFDPAQLRALEEE
jgi:hypothetical protein